MRPGLVAAFIAAHAAINRRICHLIPQAERHPAECSECEEWGLLQGCEEGQRIGHELRGLLAGPDWEGYDDLLEKHDEDCQRAWAALPASPKIRGW